MKYFVAAILVILILNKSNAQTKLGIKLTSSIITQRITNSNDSIGIDHGSNAFNPSITLFADIPLSSTYFFTAGIGYISKRINLKASRSNDDFSINKSYNIQYIRLPATLKLYTNEVALDKKLYFQVGPIIDIAVHKKETNPTYTILKEVQPIDITLLFGAGIEIHLAPQTAIQIGINYNRGLINVVRESDQGFEKMSIKNDLYGIDAAIKF